LFRNSPLSASQRWVLAILLVLLCLPEAVLVLADQGVIGTTGWRALAWRSGGFRAALLHGGRGGYPGQPVLMFLTYPWLHSGARHLLGNLIPLLPLALITLRRVGAGRFLALYLISATGGGIGFALLSDSPQPMIGASGALFGLAGAWAARDLADKGRTRFPVAAAVTALIVLNLIAWHLSGGVLAWQTHLGGFLAGWLFTRLAHYSRFAKTRS
jgi:rhomboid protease GluP